MAYKTHIGLVMGALENVWPFTFACNLRSWNRGPERALSRTSWGLPTSWGSSTFPLTCVFLDPTFVAQGLLKNFPAFQGGLDPALDVLPRASSLLGCPRMPREEAQKPVSTPIGFRVWKGHRSRDLRFSWDVQIPQISQALGRARSKQRQ